MADKRSRLLVTMKKKWKYCKIYKNINYQIKLLRRAKLNKYNPIILIDTFS